jgi:hypothetical protein
MLVVSILYVVQHTKAQGCSDAGFCSMNSFKPENANDLTNKKNQLKFGGFFGRADNSIDVYGNYIEYSGRLSKKIGIDAKVTTIAQNGNGISEFGLSDLFLSANYQATNKIKLNLGVKVPFMDANNSRNNLSLPMDYQPSLGTVDLILGMGFKFKKLQLVAALQQPLTQNNNAFLASEYPVDSKLRTFQSTNNFQRMGDVMLRVSYPIQINAKLTLTPGVLPIYHLADDKFTNELNQVQKIEGSKGLTLNGNVYFDYLINNRNAIQLNTGIPFVVRENRPDGLTRRFIANIEYKVAF